MNNRDVHLGIDLGSVSLKVVLMDGEDHVLFERWIRVAGAPLDALSNILSELSADFSESKILSVGVTGSGRGLVADMIGARAVNEISAHSAAASMMCDGVQTIIEIGGQDSKLVILGENGEVREFRMNELCAAGTGAFLDQQASRLGLSIEEFASLAEDAKSPAPIAGRCAVFAKTDMTHHQQEGRPLPDIVAGLNEALARSYMANLVRGKTIPTPISFQGGVASNRGLVKAFINILGLRSGEMIIPEHHLTMGAIGAAMIAKKTPGQPFELNKIHFKAPSPPVGEGGGEGGSNNNSHPPLNPLPSREGKIISDPKPFATDGYYLGIDAGSVSAKLVVLGPDGIAYSDYELTDGQPLECLIPMVERALEKTSTSMLCGVGVTGSGRNFIGKIFMADMIVNEITAQTIAAQLIMPHADTVFEIGGQDAKFMRIADARATEFEMNRVCAAGTGAFLQEQAIRLKIDLEKEFSDDAFASEHPADLGARCTVFMESDLVSHQQMGFSKRDLAAGLARSVATNYLEKVAGSHAIGDHILFLGGVAENRAVVAAFESLLGKNVQTSSCGRISGAIGAALSAARSKRDGAFSKSRFTAVRPDIEFFQFNCGGCPNSCLITRTKESSSKTIGGRCGKWEGSSRAASRRTKSYLHKRVDLVESFAAAQVEGQTKSAVSVGIPRALIAFDMLPLWTTFFRTLGFDVIVSPPTDKDLLSEGMKKLAVETCLPAKAFCAHLSWLNENPDVDYILVPSIITMGMDRHGRETLHCPYIQSLFQLAKPIIGKPILNPVVNWKWHPRDEEREFKKIAKQLGKSRKMANAAWAEACTAQRNFREKLRRMGSDVLSHLQDGSTKRAFVVLGKDYNICDPFLNSGAARILEDMGEVVITQDMIADDSGDYTDKFRTMVWTHGKEILSACTTAAKTKNLFPVMITSFGCGPDSFTIRFARDIAKAKPMLVLEVDEHSSAIGMETRIEAFLDSIPGGRAALRPAPLNRFPATRRMRRIIVPNFSDHGYAFAATLKLLGFEPVLTPLPDDECARLGMRHAGHGECHPYTLMLGGYIKAAMDCDFQDACYFMPDSGLCRVGQFGNQMKIVADELGLALPICTRVEDLIRALPGNSGMTPIKAVIIYWEMMRAMDFLMQKFFEVRAHEVTPGSADRARGEYKAALMECIMAGRPHDGIKNAVSILDAVPAERGAPKLRIGITGDYYTRVCDYANSEIFRDIEKFGGIVMLPPTMSEFVKYDSYQKPIWALGHGRIKELVQMLLAKRVIANREKVVRDMFGDGLMYDIPLEYGRQMKYIAPYIDKKLPSGLTASVASIFEQIHAGADGILNLITFHCTYGLIIGSVMATLEREYPGLPKLTLIFEGLKPTHNRTRLEAFMDRVASRARPSTIRCRARPSTIRCRARPSTIRCRARPGTVRCPAGRKTC